MKTQVFLQFLSSEIGLDLEKLIFHFIAFKKGVPKGGEYWF